MSNKMLGFTVSKHLVAPHAQQKDSDEYSAHVDIWDSKRLRSIGCSYMKIHTKRQRSKLFLNAKFGLVAL